MWTGIQIRHLYAGEVSQGCGGNSSREGLLLSTVSIPVHAKVKGKLISVQSPLFCQSTL